MNDAELNAFNEFYREHRQYVYAHMYKPFKVAFDAGVACGHENPVLQPMDTAPKDGTDVCLWRGEFMKVACYIKEKGQYLDKHDSYKRYLDIEDYDGWTPVPKFQ